MQNRKAKILATAIALRHGDYVSEQTVTADFAVEEHEKGGSSAGKAAIFAP